MTQWFVERDESGAVVGLNRYPTHDETGKLLTDPEPLPATHPDVQAYLQARTGDPL
jgi:hypothetical protein